MKMTSQYRRMPRAAGFSLIEMLAVIVLIGIVAGIVVQQVGKNVDKGKWGSGKAAVARLAGEVESYSLDNGGPPARLEDLTTKPGNIAGPTQQGVTNLIAQDSSAHWSSSHFRRCVRS